MDKAAIVETSPLNSLEEQEKKGKICTVAEVSRVKVLLEMVPMWTTFLVYSLVEATGSTFFIEQTTNLNDEINIGKTFIVPIVTFFVIQSFSSFAFSNMYDLLVPKLWGGANRQRTMLVRIGSGMVCSILCCITAWQVEVHRLHLVRKGRLTDKSDQTISMSIFWLAPQFCLLGLMEGLAEEGLQDFFNHHVDESMRSYGPAFGDCILGIGKFLCIPFVLAFRGWFKDTLDESHLDEYYRMLAMLSVVNLCFYWYVSNMYGAFKEAQVEEVALDPLLVLEEGFRSIVTKFHHRSWSWTAGILSSSNPHACSHYKVATVLPFRSNTFS
ncbi:protein NRT1/ PTR FAMILY 5.7-like [Cornus florida]|uniref:protein NRT1/ PTR FAMILY 5.7-like n=1 Tax=Cornus florida TaxID=4283 RepID=UPI00289EB20E|nr:protein NRT1/ PTR FAMILY 5.7-like [Cornus florida]